MKANAAVCVKWVAWSSQLILLVSTRGPIRTTAHIAPSTKSRPPRFLRPLHALFSRRSAANPQICGLFVAKMYEQIVIGGGGLAAMQAAATLRREGFAGKVTVVGEE